MRSSVSEGFTPRHRLNPRQWQRLHPGGHDPAGDDLKRHAKLMPGSARPGWPHAQLGGVRPGSSPGSRRTARSRVTARFELTGGSRAAHESACPRTLADGGALRSLPMPPGHGKVGASSDETGICLASTAPPLTRSPVGERGRKPGLARGLRNRAFPPVTANPRLVGALASTPKPVSAIAVTPGTGFGDHVAFVYPCVTRYYSPVIGRRGMIHWRRPMDGTTEGSVAASRPAATGRRLAVGLGRGTCRGHERGWAEHP